jgi:tetratricopeptide (TPR) repeat protein
VKTVLATFLIALLLLPVSAIGEIQTVTHTVNQSFGGSQSPDDARIAESYKNRGIAHASLGQRQQSIKDYSEAIRLKPDDADAYNARGNAYNRLGQYQRGIEDYNRLLYLQADPERYRVQAIP